jgi:hypothetical protein
MTESATGWRDTDLLRDGEDASDVDAELPEGWAPLFAQLEELVREMAKAFPVPGVRIVIRPLVNGARQAVARDPEQARGMLIAGARMVTAYLKIEPYELFPEQAEAKADGGGG